MLPKNYLGPCILLLLGERRAHGYSLLERLPELGVTRPRRADGRYADSATVYRTLYRLERKGLVCSARGGSSGGASRRIYDLTPAGREELRRGARRLTETSDWVGAFVGRYQSSMGVGSAVARTRRLPLARLRALRQRSALQVKRGRSP